MDLVAVGECSEDHSTLNLLFLAVIEGLGRGVMKWVQLKVLGSDNAISLIGSSECDKSLGP